MIETGIRNAALHGQCLDLNWIPDEACGYHSTHELVMYGHLFWTTPLRVQCACTSVYHHRVWCTCTYNIQLSFWSIMLISPSLPQSIVTEACNFFQYAQVLFSQDTLKQPKAFRHLHMYIHRIALSVVLPPPPLQLSETPQFPLIDASPAIPLADNLPLQKRTKQDKPRKRAGSLPSHRISDVSNQPSTTKSTKAHHRVPLTKQPSVHSDTERQRSYSFEPESHPERRRGEEPPLKEWHGLRLDLLRSRIQRLVVLMSLSEPGTVPDAGMLASLIDLVCFWSGLIRPHSYYDLVPWLSSAFCICYSKSVAPTALAPHTFCTCPPYLLHLPPRPSALAPPDLLHLPPQTFCTCPPRPSALAPQTFCTCPPDLLHLPPRPSALAPQTYKSK